jgi:ABC-type Fe3+/spermidine/putrescine transport system ATPase subunit
MLAKQFHRMSVEVKNGIKQFGGFTALTNVSLKVEVGELVALLDSSVSGQTTLLCTIVGLEFPDHPGDAQVLFYGEDITQIPASERRPWPSSAREAGLFLQPQGRL